MNVITTCVVVCVAVCTDEVDVRKKRVIRDKVSLL